MEKRGVNFGAALCALTMHFTVSYQPENRARQSGELLDDLRALLAEFEQINSFQVGIEKCDGHQLQEGLNAYFNAQCAWLIWGNPDGEWLYPVNPDWRQLEDDVEECFIENGQLDEYEIRWSVPKTEAIKLLLFYFERGELAPWLQWTDEQFWE